MRKTSHLSAIAISAAACLAGAWLGTRLGLDGRLVALGLLLVIFAALAVFTAVTHRKLRERLSELPASEQEALRQAHPVLRRPEAARRPGQLSARTAIWIGIVWINLLVFPCAIAPLALRQYLVGHAHADAIGALCLLVGFVFAWTWWSINITLWRRWAARRGVHPAELQWRGEQAHLLWPRGHFFERTELGQIMDYFRGRASSSLPPRSGGEGRP